MAHGETGSASTSGPPNDWGEQSQRAAADNAASSFDYIDIEEVSDATAGSSNGRKTGIVRKLNRLRRGNVPLVTTASYSPTQNRKKREKQYMWIQGMRLPFLFLAMLTYMWLHNMWLSAVLFIISVPLPWIAVVLANGIGEPRDPRAPAVYKPALMREQAAAMADYQRLQVERGASNSSRELPAGPAVGSGDHGAAAPHSDNNH